MLKPVVRFYGFLVIEIRILSALSDPQGQEAENILRCKIMLLFCSCSKSDGVSALFWIGSDWFSLSLTPQNASRSVGSGCPRVTGILNVVKSYSLSWLF